MKKIWNLLVLYLILSQSYSFAQNRITGKVSDESNAVLPGVNVLISGTSQGTVTDENGNYVINAAGNASLVFSFIGYVSQTVAVNNRSEINVRAFLADVYLTMAGWPLKQTDKYDLAAAKAKEVIDNKDLYGFQLLPTFAAVFENDPAVAGTAEAVFQISGFAGGSGTANATYGNTTMPGEEGGWDDMFAELNFFKDFPAGPRKDATFRTEFGLGATKISWDKSLTKHRCRSCQSIQKIKH